MLAVMDGGDARAPRPPHGDPNTKAVRLSLETGEWRQLRAWAAEEGTSVEDVIARALREVLEGRPRVDY